MIQTHGRNVQLSIHNDRWSTLRHNKIGPCTTIAPTTDIHSELTLGRCKFIANFIFCSKWSLMLLKFNSPNDPWCIIYFSTSCNSEMTNEFNDSDDWSRFLLIKFPIHGQIQFWMSFKHLLHLHGVGGVSCDGPRPTFPPKPVMLKSELMNLLTSVPAAVVSDATVFIVWLELWPPNTKYPFTCQMKRHKIDKMIRFTRFPDILNAPLDLVMRKIHRIQSNYDLLNEVFPQTYLSFHIQPGFGSILWLQSRTTITNMTLNACHQ